MKWITFILLHTTISQANHNRLTKPRSFFLSDLHATVWIFKLRQDATGQGNKDSRIKKCHVATDGTEKLKENDEQ